ncbi:MAG TPA: TetR/AcrR family transcriptional regulator [Campylobacterales bacterium]|nr:TetR/AcrR family transcriptional regulator [Campylobacterales bacterium]
MPIIVDKAQKRKDIALSCKELFITHGIKDLTISQLAKTAGVGKGTMYDYFKNKEDIVFEVINILMVKHNLHKEKELSDISSTKEKIKIFFNFFYSKKDESLRTLYKEFISISLITANEEMIDFQTTCFENYYQWFRQILQEGIDKGEIIPHSIHFAKGLFATGEGLFIASVATKAIADVEKELNIYIDTLFQLIEVKK